MMIHVMPINDDRGHHPDTDCACQPLIQDVDGTDVKIAIHHAWDCREPYERMMKTGKPAKGWQVLSQQDGE